MGDSPATACLELHLSTSKGVYQGQEPITSILTLRNSGPSSVVINARFLLDLRLFESEIYFSIIDRTGHTYPYLVIIQPRAVTKDDFISLDPGAEQVLEYDLRELFGLRERQRFTAQAFYRNRHEHQDPDVRAWLGEVASNAIEFVTA